MTSFGGTALRSEGMLTMVQGLEGVAYSSHCLIDNAYTVSLFQGKFDLTAKNRIATFLEITSLFSYLN